MRFGVMIFANRAVFQSSRRIEITQADIADAVSEADPLHHFFHNQLSFAVSVGRQSSIGFQNRNALRLAVSGGG